MRLRAESYEAINDCGGTIDPALMLFVSCPNWGVNTNNYGTWDICPHASQTNDNGNVQGYAEFLGGPGQTQLTQINQTFGYDSLNRLNAASEGANWSRNFGYDQYGNMWLSAANGGTVSGVTPRTNVWNATTNRDGGLTYDAAGNVTSSPNSSGLGYNAENMVTSLGGGTWTYAYDGLGERVQKKYVSGAGTLYAYDALGKLAAEYATSGSSATWTKDYIRWGSSGTLIATENAAGSGPCTTCYLGFDHLGSARLVMDQNANVVARHDYYPFGEEIQAGTGGRSSQFGLTTDVTTKFTGQIRDQESAMDFFNARNFAPAFMRFNSPDPGNAGANLADPQTWNGYAYVRGNPLNTIDPSGMDGFGTGDPGEPDPCFEDPWLCNPFPPIDFPPVTAPQPPPPVVTSSAGGNPLPPGSFPNGESLGLPPGITIPGPFGLPNPFIMSVAPAIGSTTVVYFPEPPGWVYTIPGLIFRGVATAFRRSPPVVAGAILVLVLTEGSKAGGPGDTIVFAKADRIKGIPRIDQLQKSCSPGRTVEEPSKSIKGGTSLEQEYICSFGVYTVHTLIDASGRIVDIHVRPGPPKGGGGE